MLLEIRFGLGINIIYFLHLMNHIIKKVKWIRKTKFYGPLHVVAELRLGLPTTLTSLLSTSR